MKNILAMAAAALLTWPPAALPGYISQPEAAMEKLYAVVDAAIARDFVN